MEARVAHQRLGAAHRRRAVRRVRRGAAARSRSRSLAPPGPDGALRPPTAAGGPGRAGPGPARARARTARPGWEAIRQDPERSLAAYRSLVLRVAKWVCGRTPRPGADEELGVGLAALFEASRAYRPEAGVPFEAFATMVVRRRLVDHYRRVRRRREIPMSTWEREDEDGAVWCGPENAAAIEAAGRAQDARETRDDLADFVRLIGRHGISLRDVLRQRPRHRDAQRRAVAVARRLVADPARADRLRRDGSLPLRQLEQAGRPLGVSRKTVERRRRYILAVALMLAEGFPRLEAYLPTA